MGRRLLVIGGVWMLLHAYMGARLLNHAALGPGSLTLAWGALLLLALGPFAAFFALREGDSPLGAALQWTGFTALGLSSILLVLVVAAAAGGACDGAYRRLASRSRRIPHRADQRSPRRPDDRAAVRASGRGYGKRA